MMESDYPYKMENSYCVYDKGMRQKAGATIRKVVKIRPGTRVSSWGWGGSHNCQSAHHAYLLGNQII